MQMTLVHSGRRDPYGFYVSVPKDVDAAVKEYVASQLWEAEVHGVEDVRELLDALYSYALAAYEEEEHDA